MSYPVHPSDDFPFHSDSVDTKEISELRLEIEYALKKVGRVHIAHDGYFTRAYLVHNNIMILLSYYQDGDRVRVVCKRMNGMRLSFIRAMDYFFHYLVGRELPTTWGKPLQGTLAENEETEDLNIGYKMSEDEVNMTIAKLSDNFTLENIPTWITCDESNRVALLAKGIALELEGYLEETGMSYERKESLVRAMDALRVPFDVSKWADITSTDSFHELRCREIRQRVENILQRV